MLNQLLQLREGREEKYGLFRVMMIWRVFICDAFGIAASLEISLSRQLKACCSGGNCETNIKLVLNALQ